MATSDSMLWMCRCVGSVLFVRTHEAPQVFSASLWRDPAMALVLGYVNPERERFARDPFWFRRDGGA